jgi:hypothetical protein
LKAPRLKLHRTDYMTLERYVDSMQRYVRSVATSLSLLAFVALFAVALSACGAAPVAQAAPAVPPDQAVITAYIAALNAGIQSGDFSQLLAIYAPDAVLTASPPTGVTKVSTGTAEIEAYFQAFRMAHPGVVFAVDSVHIISPHVVLTYEHASPPHWAAPGRCMHVYILKAGKVQSLDWATFYGGKAS